MSVDGLRLATGPVSWGVDFADAPDNPPWQRVLDEIAQSGIGALELGPVGYLPEQPDQLRQALDGRGLTAVGSFLFEDLHDPAARDHVLEVAERACRTISAAGGNVLVIIDRPGRTRASTAGRSHFAPRLPTGLWLLMVRLIKCLAELAREHGLEPAFHPHAGSYIEFTDEIDRLLGDTDVGLCLDTGHLTYAGIRAQDAIGTYGSRIVHMHLKDVAPRVMDRVRFERLNFWHAIRGGVFCPLGLGVVELNAVADALESIRYAGYVTIEQDRAPATGTPLDDLRKSLGALTRAGMLAASRRFTADTAP